MIKTYFDIGYRINKEQLGTNKRAGTDHQVAFCSQRRLMGVCASCVNCGKNNQVIDITDQLGSDSSSDVYVERITHISADIHEMIRKRDHSKVTMNYMMQSFHSTTMI